MTRLPRATVALVLLGSTTACFHYVPAETVPSQGTPVRAHLDPPVPVQLRDITANSVVRVTGEVVTSDSEQIILSAFSVEGAGNQHFAGGGSTVSLPRDALQSLEERRLSTGRTALAGVGVAVAGYLIQLGLRAAVGGGDTDGGGGVAK